MQHDEVKEKECISSVKNIKIMPCVEGDRSDCQPEPSSIARTLFIFVL